MNIHLSYEVVSLSERDGTRAPNDLIQRANASDM